MQYFVYGVGCEIHPRSVSFQRRWLHFCGKGMPFPIFTEVKNRLCVWNSFSLFSVPSFSFKLSQGYFILGHLFQPESHKPFMGHRNIWGNHSRFALSGRLCEGKQGLGLLLVRGRFPVWWYYSRSVITYEGFSSFSVVIGPNRTSVIGCGVYMCACDRAG